MCKLHTPTHADSPEGGMIGCGGFDHNLICMCGCANTPAHSTEWRGRHTPADMSSDTCVNTQHII